jgi:hypothetical protein
MRAKIGLAVLCALALTVPSSAVAKGFTRVVFVGANGRSVEVRAGERAVDGLLSRRGSPARARGEYVRLFFVGPGDFPASPARYYPDGQCVALDWPTYETSCRRVDAAIVRRAAALSGFRARPTVLTNVDYEGTFTGVLRTADALSTPVELALDRVGRPARQPRHCYGFKGRWRGPAAAARPRRFLLCAAGIYARRHLYPLRRGVWEWFRANVGLPARRVSGEARSARYNAAGLTVTMPRGWRVVHRRLTPCTNPAQRLAVTGRGALVVLLESLDPQRYIRRFPGRPRRFELHGQPEPIGCCAPDERAGWFFSFRDRARGFYGYVYLGAPGTRDEVLAILDSLRVQPRRA